MTVLLFVLGVVVFAVGVAVSIGLHEVGHMVPAKRFGVKVTQYFVGFGPTAWSKQIGETEYGVKWIPLGGYVKLVGMLPPDPAHVASDGTTRVRKSNTGMFTQLISDARSAEYELVTPADEDRLFYRLPWWKKVIVMSGGPLVNLAIAFVLFAGIFGIYGTTEATTTVGTVSRCVIVAEQAPRPCLSTDPASPAFQAGIRPGDTITSFNGTPIMSWEQAVGLIRANAAGTAVIGLDRDGQPLTVTTNTTVNSVRSLSKTDTFEQAGFLGVVSTTEQVQHGLLYTTQQMASNTWDVVGALGQLPVKVYGVGRAVLGLQDRAADSPVSVVGAGRVAGDVVSDSTSPWADRVAFLALLLAGLNLFVGMFNFIPLLPLDGGHIAGALYEALRRGWARLRGRPDPGFVDVAKLLPVAYVVGSVLLVMGIVLILGDLVAPIQVG